METFTNLAYLVATSLFILGLKGLGSPKTARRGNLQAASGMLIAIVVTLFDSQIINLTYIVTGLVVGSLIGLIAAKKVEMTNMPQMVAIFNGFGGGASALVAMAEYWGLAANPSNDIVITIMLSILIGSVTFTGSIVAFAKLQGLVKGAPVVLPMHQLINAALILALLLMGLIVVMKPTWFPIVLLIVLISAVLGVLSVIPIGGADMPVVISLLNSYSGLAAAATGFVISNNVLIVSGSLVGAAGLILTQIMCRAMNRSLTNVLFGAVGTGDAGEEAAGAEGAHRAVTEYSTEDAAMMLESARSVIIVPGYGLAVAQAQHVIHDLAKLLIQKGATVRFAIHPVAGRMPGHMNVLLAEANVSYDLLYALEDINEDFQHTDVALVIGANDVVNPAAITNKNSPLYGMPILNVDHARSVIVCKRSLRPGFAGEDNDLFYNQNTMMVFGDAKATVSELVKLLKG